MLQETRIDPERQEFSASSFDMNKCAVCASEDGVACGAEAGSAFSGFFGAFSGFFGALELSDSAASCSLK